MIMTLMSDQHRKNLRNLYNYYKQSLIPNHSHGDINSSIDDNADYLYPFISNWTIIITNHDHKLSWEGRY